MATLRFPPPPPPPQQLLPYPSSRLASPSPPRGAYTPTFVVLAVIAALAVIACVLGHVWARRYLRPRSKRAYDVEEDDFGMIAPTPKPAAAVDGMARVAGGGATKAGSLGDDDGGPR